MDRLVYSPSIKAWVKTDTGIVDLSPYIVSCQVNRNISDVSKAQLQFRNPKVLKDGKPRFLFTENEVDGKILPVFHPMDPITIVLERIPGRPIQVFTGYCDTVPDVQLFPGTATITASCTLKRLLYTYMDAALPFVQKFLQSYGWDLNNATGVAGNIATDTEKISKSNNLNDSSIGHLLYAVLNEIGGWDDSNIYIQPLPANIAPLVTSLFDEITKDNKRVNKEITDFIRRIIGQGSFGSSTVGGTDTDSGEEISLSGPVENEREIVNTIRSIATQEGIPPEFILAIAIVETRLLGDDGSGAFPWGSNNPDYIGWYQWKVSGDHSYYPPKFDINKATDLGYATKIICKKAKATERFKSMGWDAWARSVQLAPGNPYDSDVGVNADPPKENDLFGSARFPEFIAEARRLLKQYE